MPPPASRRPAFRKPLSPAGHRRVDTIALPGLLALAGLTALLGDRRTAALMGVVAAGEGAAMLTTAYPPRVAAGWLSFRQHVAVANLHGLFIAGLALLVPGVPRRGRLALLALALVPWTLNALSRVPPPGEGGPRASTPRPRASGRRADEPV